MSKPLGQPPRWVLWLLRAWPFMLRSTAHARMDATYQLNAYRLKEAQRGFERSLQALRAQHAQALESASRFYAAEVERLSRLTWTRDREEYALTLSFDARVTHFATPSGAELVYLAERLGQQVEAEIRTSRFIRKAVEVLRPMPRLP